MDEKDAWVRFTVTGSVADYLRYSAVKEESSANNEEDNERACDKGNADGRGGQAVDDTYT